VIERLVPETGLSAIVIRSVLVSGTATTLAVVFGVPLGYVIARKGFPGRTLS
jgi:ABC-type sulfate transport system permease component